MSKLISATGGIMPSISNPAILRTFHSKSARLSQRVTKNILLRQCHIWSSKSSLLQAHSQQLAIASNKKFWSNDSKSNQPFLPPLMDSPTRPAWRPPIYRGMWMVFQVNTIRSKLDPEFSLQDFMQGARQVRASMHALNVHFYWGCPILIDAKLSHSSFCSFGNFEQQKQT